MAKCGKEIIKSYEYNLIQHVKEHQKVHNGSV